MVTARYLTLVSALMLAVPAARVDAQVFRGPSSTYNQSAYDEGYRRGERVGQEDGGRGAAFNFGIAQDFRRGDIGWTARFGSRERYRDDFRVGFEAGYRSGYERFRANRRVGPQVWSRERAGNGFGYGNERVLALNNGYNDGYQEGLSDGRNRHRDAPTAESRYRNADHGYDQWYGAREGYRVNYRRSFIDGYETGYRDGWGYR
jgi:hypothetical protein